jgi:hypothetical protein
VQYIYVYILNNAAPKYGTTPWNRSERDLACSNPRYFAPKFRAVGTESKDDDAQWFASYAARRLCVYI